mgnify:CR=1 FL=1
MAFEMEIRKIENPHTRQYMREVISDYNNGNFRSAVIMLYVVIMSDIVEKLDSLSGIYSNEAAKEILAQLSDRSKYDASRERFLFEQVQKRLPAMLPNEAVATIKSLKEWRNVSAHPSLAQDSPEPLGRPSQETVAGLIRESIDTVFSQSADLSTRSFSPFLDTIAENENSFADDSALKNFLEKKYFTKFQASTYNYMVEHLFSIVFTSTDNDSTQHRYINFKVLIMLIGHKRERSLTYLTKSSRFQNLQIQEPDILDLLMQFFRNLPESFEFAPYFARHQIELKTKIDPNLKLINFYLDASNLTVHISTLLKELGQDNDYCNFFDKITWTSAYVEAIRKQLLETGDIAALNKLSILVYGESTNFDSADARFEYLIAPQLKSFTQDEFQLLFKKAGKNSQCYARSRATSDHWTAFVEYKKRFSPDTSLAEFQKTWPFFAQYVADPS